MVTKLVTLNFLYERHDNVFSFIEANPHCTVRDIFVNLDYNKAEIYNSIAFLIKKDLIDKHYKFGNLRRVLYTAKSVPVKCQEYVVSV